MQVSLRHFNNSDCDFISQKLWKNTTYNEIIAMITKWDTLKYKGSYFEMFAIEADLQLAGYASLYEITGNASLGLEIIPQNRNKGIGYKAAMEIMCRAKNSGYKKATARVLMDNLPSLSLCKKLDFTIISNDITAAGKPVYCLEKVL